MGRTLEPGASLRQPHGTPFRISVTIGSDRNWRKGGNAVTSLVSYLCEDSIATLTMDDGKVNVLSPQMLDELGAALDRAEQEAGVVVLTGREGRFSGGFDLAILQGGGRPAIDMLDAGFALAERLLRFPKPVVAACNGHAIAMAAFLLNSVDYRIGAAGAYRITANEVTLGLTMPLAAVEICRQRLTPAHFHRAVSLAEVYSPAGGGRRPDSWTRSSTPLSWRMLLAPGRRRCSPSIRPRTPRPSCAPANKPCSHSPRPAPPTTPTFSGGSAPARSPRWPGPSSARRSFASACSLRRWRCWRATAPARLTTRAVARAAGTSVPAVYELFGDKAGLVRELFFTGFRRLHERLLARPRRGDPRAIWSASAATFRAFARAEPVLAQLMFSRPFARVRSEPGRCPGGRGGARSTSSSGSRRQCRRGCWPAIPSTSPTCCWRPCRGSPSRNPADGSASTAASVERRWHLAVGAVLHGLAQRRTVS